MWSFFSFFFLFFWGCLRLLSPFPGATQTCKFIRDYMYFHLIKALLLVKKSHFFLFLLVLKKKKSPNSRKSFLPTKTKKICEKYFSDPHAFLLSFFFTLIIQSSQKLLGFWRQFLLRPLRIVSLSILRAVSACSYFAASPPKGRGMRRSTRQRRCAGTRGGFCEAIFILCPFWKTRGRRPEASDAQRRMTEENDGKGEEKEDKKNEWKSTIVVGSKPREVEKRRKVNEKNKKCIKMYRGRTKLRILLVEDDI